MKRRFYLIFTLILIIGVVTLESIGSSSQKVSQPETKNFAEAEDFYDSLCVAARNQLKDKVRYDGSYYSMDYPMGDVPKGVGVCTDVVIRSYRELDIDLQQLIHEDMKRARSEYNGYYHTKHLDPSIDHRRTQNQETFLKRQGAELSITKNADDYKPGDLVFWDVANGHVGIVIDQKAPSGNYYIVHNIGRGNEKEDFLFGAEIVGHYRWSPR